MCVWSGEREVGRKGELEKEVQREMHIRKATEIQSPEHFLTPILGQRKKNGYPLPEAFNTRCIQLQTQHPFLDLLENVYFKCQPAPIHGKDCWKHCFAKDPEACLNSGGIAW